MDEGTQIQERAGGSSEGWMKAVGFGDLPDRRPTRVNVDGVDVLVVRSGEEVFAIANRCPHQGAPLHRGPVRFSGSLKTVQCPIHGSTFALADGKVLRGPATQPPRAYETRIVDGTVEIRPRAGNGAA